MRESCKGKRVPCKKDAVYALEKIRKGGGPFGETRPVQETKIGRLQRRQRKKTKRVRKHHEK